MRNFLLIAVFTFLASGVYAELDERGQSLGKSLSKGFTKESVEADFFQPLTSEAPMHSIDGETRFETRLECESQPRFMTVRINPTQQADIGHISASFDWDMDGTADQNSQFTGPIGAVCSNGFLRCPAAQNTPCEGQRWLMTNGQLTTMEMPPRELGGCYCFNDSCGENLLENNREKVLKDIGTGIARESAKAYPRLAIGKHEYLGDNRMAFSGQQSGCGADAKPEQYYNNPNAMSGAGKEEAEKDPVYSLLTESQSAGGSSPTVHQCSVNRGMTLETVSDPYDILEVTAKPGQFTRSTCGERCEEFKVWVPRMSGGGWIPWYAFYSSIHHRDVTFKVKRPDLIKSAKIRKIYYDDWVYTAVGNTIVYRDRGDWNGTGPNNRYYHRTENNNRGTRHPGTQLAGEFNVLAPNSSLLWKNSVAIYDKGQLESILRIEYDTGCELKDERVDSTCQTLEGDTACSIRNENVDGVQTIENHYRTELSPYPSQRTFTSNGCSVSATRDFWQIKREYACEAEQQYDFDYAREREQHISNSQNVDDGTFNDRRTDEEGNVSYHAMTSPAAPQGENSCIEMCKVRAPKAGTSMGQHGSTSEHNKTGVAYDITYKECDLNICPLEGNEELVNPCNCNSNFVEAMTTMQTIRMVKEDMVCEPD